MSGYIRLSIADMVYTHTHTHTHIHTHTHTHTHPYIHTIIHTYNINGVNLIEQAEVVTNEEQALHVKTK